MTTRTRSEARAEFLGYLLTTAMEHSGYGFPELEEYHVPEGHFDEWFAVITNRYLDAEDDDYGKTYRVDINTMAKGLGILRKTENPSDWVKELLVADRTNGADGDYDVIGALAVLECALFGFVVYA